MLLVGHLGLAGDVLVGHQLGLAIDHPVGEGGPVHDRAQISAAQLAVATVIDVLVGGGVAQREDEGVPDRIENGVGLLHRQRIGVVA